MHEVWLTPKMAEFVKRAVSSRRYDSVDEMVAAGLRRLDELHGNTLWRRIASSEKNATLFGADKIMARRSGDPQSTRRAADHGSEREEAFVAYRVAGSDSSDPTRIPLSPQVLQYAKEEVAAGIYVDIGEVVRAAIRTLMEKDGTADFFRLQASFAKSLEGPFIEVEIDELIDSMRAGMLDRAEEPTPKSD